MLEGFFEEATEQSQVKSEIVAAYFGAWVSIMARKARSEKLAYVDLFAGPGRYKDGSKSTPIKVMEQIITNPELTKRIVTIFNDADPISAKALRQELSNLHGYDKLKYKPQVLNSRVGNEIVELFERMRLVPTLGFIDPWGYLGLSSRLIKAMAKDWGCDCIFFFNYNRINMGISNPAVDKHMDSIFGKVNADQLRETLQSLPPKDRELVILNELSSALSEGKSKYVLPFRFVMPNRERTSHYLILVSKHVLGYTIMKDIMWRNSSEYNDGVASFSFIPVRNPHQLDFLAMFNPKPLDELGIELCKTYKGKCLTVKQIIDEHHPWTPYVSKNYKEALRRLEACEKIQCTPTKRRIKDGAMTMGDNVEVTFPRH
jgi:three-Cys-motif partner protein